MPKSGAYWPGRLFSVTFRDVHTYAMPHRMAQLNSIGKKLRNFEVAFMSSMTPLSIVRAMPTRFARLLLDKPARHKAFNILAIGIVRRAY